MRRSSAALFGVHDVTAAGRGGRPLVQGANVKPSTSERFLGERRRGRGVSKASGGVSEVTKRLSDAGREREGERGRAVVASSPEERSRASRQMLGRHERWPGVKTLWSGRWPLGDSLVDDGAGRGRRLPLSSHACASAMRLSTRCHKPQRRGGRRRAPRPPRVERRDGLMEGKKRHSEAGGGGRGVCRLLCDKVSRRGAHRPRTCGDRFADMAGVLLLLR